MLLRERDRDWVESWDILVPMAQDESRPRTFRAEKRSAQASAHLLSQAQGGLFCVLTVFVCCWSSE